MSKLQDNDRHLLLGVTGGIASGKTTVADMLEELGAGVIDFDILAREVVEPGKPAWEDIVEYFGKEVLDRDGFIDRKKLSEIVFKDKEKRGKLEIFTHSRIDGLFINRVKEITASDPEAIIQAVVPLMFELNMQDRFHKSLLVYVSPEVQIERLINRDNLTREEAMDRLNAQMPIDEKISYADFVIFNDQTLEQTKKHVKELWVKLKNIHRGK